MFVSPTNLHCSQTVSPSLKSPSAFVSPTNLHCSQTVRRIALTGCSLFPLRIYTALKLWLTTGEGEMVCFPYKFTLLSNLLWDCTSNQVVCFPYKFTLLSNAYAHFVDVLKFVSPTNLHCSQTGNMFCHKTRLFVSPTNLHCSQTASVH